MGDIPVHYKRLVVEIADILRDEDIVYSARKLAAVHKRTRKSIAALPEYKERNSAG